MVRKILVVCSGGGHWTQLQRVSNAFAGLDVAYVTVRAHYADEVSGHRFYLVRDATRWDRAKIPLLAIQLLRILFKERPDIVVTTGAAPGLLAVILAKLLLRSKTIWIDSIANREHMSLSGLRARRFADVWLTQWPHLAQKAGPHYWGAVL